MGGSLEGAVVSNVFEASGGMHDTADFFAVVQPSVVPAPRAVHADSDPTDAPGLRASRGPHPSSNPGRQTLALTSMLVGSLAVAASLILTGTSMSSNAFALGGLDQAALTASTSQTGALSATAVVNNVSGHFGEAITYSDGLVINVAPAVPFDPTREATGDDQAANVTMIVTVTNTTQSTLAPYLRASVVSGAAKTAGTAVSDDRSGLGSAPAALLKPGQVVTYLIGFSVADPNAITLSMMEPSGSIATITK